MNSNAYIQKNCFLSFFFLNISKRQHFAGKPVAVSLRPEISYLWAENLILSATGKIYIQIFKKMKIILLNRQSSAVSSSYDK